MNPSPRSEFSCILRYTGPDQGDRAIKLLGIDVGTGGTRALLIDESGAVVASAIHEHEPFASPRSGWAEQDPHDWWKACQGAVRKLLADSGISGLGDCLHRAERSNARRGAFGPQRRGIAAGAHLVRSANGGGMPLPQRNHRGAAPGGADLEPRAHQLYSDQAAVGADQRTRNLAEDFTAFCCPRTTSASVSPGCGPSTWRTLRAPYCSTWRIAAGPRP